MTVLVDTEIRQLTDEGSSLEQQLLEEQQRLQKEQRNTLAEEVRNMLNAYQTQRNQQYLKKDFLFSSSDKTARDTFIKDIGVETNDVNELQPVSGLLAAYVESGNSNALIQKIAKEMGNFPGVTMQATLNRVLVKLLDAESVGLVAPPHENATQTLTTLKEQGGKAKEYAEKMEALYAQIEEMRNFATTTLPVEKQEAFTASVIDKLQQDVDRFVLANPEKVGSTPIKGALSSN